MTTPVFHEKTPNNFVRWEGERIDGMSHPLNVGDLWSDEALATVKLYRPAEADTVPAGKSLNGKYLSDINGL